MVKLAHLIIIVEMEIMGGKKKTQNDEDCRNFCPFLSTLVSYWL